VGYIIVCARTQFLSSRFLLTRRVGGVRGGY